MSSVTLFPPLASSSPRESEISEGTGLSDMQWGNLAAVQEHIFPACPDSPGAGDINATEYLRTVLSGKDIDSEMRTFIYRGVDWLERFTREKHGASFEEMSESGRESVLRGFATDIIGEIWLSTILIYIFEALLCDPVYGGNPNQTGWEWLEHKPGFPRPPADKLLT